MDRTGEHGPARGGRRASVPRLVWAVAAGVALALAAALTGVRWAPPPAGLPDAGRLVVDGLPALRLLTLLGGGILAGFAVSAVALDPDAAGAQLSRRGRRDLAVAAAGAAVLVPASILLALLTLADVLGMGLGEALDPRIVATYLWDVEVCRAHLVAAGCAAAAGVGLWQVRSLGAAAGWTVLGLAAAGIPSLTGHAAGLGNHSLALVSGFLHAVAAAVWGGGVVAIAPHALLGSPAMRERVRRFGVVAVAAVITLGLTGVASAATRLDGPGQLLTTAYGRTVLAKVVALGLALALGAASRRSWRRRVAGSPGVLLAELVALGSAVGVAVVLARSAYPRTELQLPTLGEDLIGYPYPPAPTVRAVTLGWHPDWVWLVAAALAVGLYVSGYVSLRRRGDAWPVGRLVAWLLGWGAVVWATCAGVGWYAPVSFALHMISHMVLAMLAPVLLVLGGPVTLALRVIPAAGGGQRGPREWIIWGLRTPVARFVTHPAYALLVFTVGLYGLYYTDLYAWMMASHLGHLAMQVHFLAAGYLFYWVVIGVDAGPRTLPHSARLILLMASLVIHSFFAVPMMMTEAAMVPDWYAVVRPPWLTDPLADTHVAGAIAWGFGELPTLVVAVVLAVQWARSDEREARRRDRLADRDGDAELRAYNARLARLDARASGRVDPDGSVRDHGPGQ